MAGEITLASLDGNFKDQFHDDVEELIPDHVILQRNDFIDWVPSDKMNGEFYSVPTLLRSSQGVTYLGETGAVGDLETPVAAVMKEAQIKGSELNVRGQLSYKVLSQASAAGPKAFKKASAWLVEDLAQVAFTRIEIAALYGQSGIGTIESVVDNTGNADVVISEATFAPGLWIPLEGARLDSFSGTTLMNTGGALTLNSVTTSTRTLNISYTGAFGTQLVAAQVLFPRGAAITGGTFNEMIGLRKQFTATTGTLFNINRASYSLIQGNTKSSIGTPTKAKIVDAAMLAVDKGAMSGLTVLVSTKMWSKLAAEDMALRMFDGSYSKEKSQSGSKELIYDFLGGSIKVVCHPMVKYGEAFLFNPEDVIWVGSAKPTFEIPSMPEKFFRLVQDKNAVELQNYADIAIYALKPSQCVMLTGITYA